MVHDSAVTAAGKLKNQYLFYLNIVLCPVYVCRSTVLQVFHMQSPPVFQYHHFTGQNCLIKFFTPALPVSVKSTQRSFLIQQT